MDRGALVEVEVKEGHEAGGGGQAGVGGALDGPAGEVVALAQEAVCHIHLVAVGHGNLLGVAGGQVRLVGVGVVGIPYVAVELHLVGDRSPVGEEGDRPVGHDEGRRIGGRQVRPGQGVQEVAVHGVGPAVEDVALPVHVHGIRGRGHGHGVSCPVELAGGRRVHGAALYGVGVVGDGVADLLPDGVEGEGGLVGRGQVAHGLAVGVSLARALPVDVPLLEGVSRPREAARHQVEGLGGIEGHGLAAHAGRGGVGPVAVEDHGVGDGGEAGIEGRPVEPGHVGVLGGLELGVLVHDVAGGVLPGLELVARRLGGGGAQGPAVAGTDLLLVGRDGALAGAHGVVDGAHLGDEPGVDGDLAGREVGLSQELGDLAEGHALVQAVGLLVGTGEAVLGVVPAHEVVARELGLEGGHHVVGVPGNVRPGGHVGALGRVVVHHVGEVGPTGVKGGVVVEEVHPGAGGEGDPAVLGLGPAVEPVALAGHVARATQVDRVGGVGAGVLDLDLGVGGRGICPAAPDLALGVGEGVGHGDPAGPLGGQDHALVRKGEGEARVLPALAVYPLEEGPVALARGLAVHQEGVVTGAEGHGLALAALLEVGARGPLGGSRRLVLVLVGPCAVGAGQEGGREDLGPLGHELGVAQDPHLAGIGGDAFGHHLVAPTHGVGPGVEGEAVLGTGDDAAGVGGVPVEGVTVGIGVDSRNLAPGGVGVQEGDEVGLGRPLGVEHDVGPALAGEVGDGRVCRGIGDGGAVGQDLRARGRLPTREVVAHPGEGVWRQGLGRAVGEGLA